MSEELTRIFSLGLSVEKCENDSSSIHPRLDEFKGRNYRSGVQANRRKNYLDHQKKRRFDAANYARKLADGDLNENEFEEISLETVDEMDVDEKKKRKDKKFNPYKNQLMLSEWIVDPPTDLTTNWLMVVCPVGKRVLIVAHKGHTTAYSKGGHVLNRFPSLLPGGSYKTWKKDNNFARSFTLLDCIYDEVNRTYWMLDLMCYKGNPIYDSEVDFRFFWLNSKLLEDAPKLSEQSSVNPFKFKPCKNVLCEKTAIVNAVTDTYPFEIDGVLFYHKLGHYGPGRTPLVGWLKPYMIPEILDIPMPLTVMDTAPVEFNRDILKNANKELQNTTSDRSFNNPKDVTRKKKDNQVSMES